MRSIHDSVRLVVLLLGALGTLHCASETYTITVVDSAGNPVSGILVVVEIDAVDAGSTEYECKKSDRDGEVTDSVGQVAIAEPSDLEICGRVAEVGYKFAEVCQTSYSDLDNILLTLYRCDESAGFGECVTERPSNAEMSCNRT